MMQTIKSKQSDTNHIDFNLILSLIIIKNLIVPYCILINDD